MLALVLVLVLLLLLLLWVEKRREEKRRCFCASSHYCRPGLRYDEGTFLAHIKTLHLAVNMHAKQKRLALVQMALWQSSSVVPPSVSCKEKFHRVLHMSHRPD
ncbi:unnamed protein product [Discosporangium mesarthrocarpum]